MAIKRDLYNNIRDIDVCIAFRVLKVKVLVIFLIIKGFSLRKDKRYTLNIK
jgi:hypothetical protein